MLVKSSILQHSVSKIRQKVTTILLHGVSPSTTVVGAFISLLFPNYPQTFFFHISNTLCSLRIPHPTRWVCPPTSERDDTSQSHHLPHLPHQCAFLVPCWKCPRKDQRGGQQITKPYWTIWTHRGGGAMWLPPLGRWADNSGCPYLEDMRVSERDRTF